MKLQIVLSAVALAAFGGSAHAQNTTGTGTGVTTTPTTGVNTGSNTGINNGFVNPFQFVPNAGFANPGGFVNPFTGQFNNGQFNNGFNNGQFSNGQFNNGFNNGFAPGLGNSNALGIDPTTGQPITSFGGGSLFNGFNPGFASGGFPYGGGYYNPYGYGGQYNMGMTPNMNTNPNFGPAAGARGRVPILGLNVPATAIARGPRARVRQLTPTNDQRLRDTPDGVAVVNPASNPDTGNVAGSATPRDFGVVSAATNMMASDRPLRGGRLMSVNGSDATVQYSINGQNQTAYVPLREVFFFRSNGEMTSLAQAGSGARAGSSVMIADPMQRPLQSVAGSRQSYSKMRVTNKVTGKAHKKSTKKTHKTRRTR